MSVIRRLENKYLLTPEAADHLADHLRALLDPDPFSPDPYTVHSLYFDTPELRFYRANTLKLLRRAKPRARYYGAAPAPPLMLELKRKDGDRVTKSRADLPLERWPHILQEPPGDDPFLLTVALTGALPAVHVRYERLAFVSPFDTYARVTLDRSLRAAHACADPRLDVAEADLTLIDDPDTASFHRSPVILELKCEQPPPRWMTDLVRAFHLTQTGFSKYVAAIERLQVRSPLS